MSNATVTVDRWYRGKGEQIRDLRPESEVPLYNKYPGQSKAQDAFLELDEDGSATFLIDPEIGNAVPERVWNGRCLWWKVPNNLTPQGYDELMLDVLPDLRIVHAERDIQWDGSNHVGRISDAGKEVIQNIEHKIELTYEPNNDNLKRHVEDAEDHFGMQWYALVDEYRHWTGTDAEFEKDLREGAMDLNVVLTNMDEAMDQIRKDANESEYAE